MSGADWLEGELAGARRSRAGETTEYVLAPCGSSPTLPTRLWAGYLCSPLCLSLLLL